MVCVCCSIMDVTFSPYSASPTSQFNDCFRVSFSYYNVDVIKEAASTIVRFMLENNFVSKCEAKSHVRCSFTKHSS